nr:PREDICTED: phosphoribosyl pyrophosphate synthase-associated protein 2 isoform X2 [Latimeria chalumnae]|eukprot:XP_014344774.1 PREDICTED: phosphoribosyl pyrophosphate synthase-associated protein 2 isoform X2 [Latimeria chalumnae]
MNVTKGGLSLFSANSNSSCVELAKKIAEDVNTTIMELLIMVYACKTSCARSIIGVIPYFPYSKQCKMRKRGSIVSKLLACMMCKAGLTHLITMDLHQKEIQGFFNIPVDNLRASPFLLQYIQEEIPDYRNAVIVAKSPASAKRAQSFAERLRLGIAVIHGEAQDAESDLVDGRHSPPMVKNAAAIHPSLELPCLRSNKQRLIMPKSKDKNNKSDFFNCTPRSTQGKDCPPFSPLQAAEEATRPIEGGVTLQKLYDQMTDTTTRIKNAVSQMGLKIDKLTSRMVQIEDQMGKAEQSLKESAVKVKHCEEFSEHSLSLSKAVVKENQQLKRRLELTENQLRGANLCILGLPEGREHLDFNLLFRRLDT